MRLCSAGQEHIDDLDYFQIMSVFGTILDLLKRSPVVFS